jgi:hypothetical protein
MSYRRYLNVATRTAAERGDGHQVYQRVDRRRSDLFDGEVEKQMLGMYWQGWFRPLPGGDATVSCQGLIPDSLDEVAHYVATRCGRHQACGRQT